MKVSIRYDELVKVLSFSNTILGDKSVDEKMKNIIFVVKKGRALVIGYNALTFCRTELMEVDTEGIEEDKVWEFQVKAGNLNKIVSSFSNMYKTKVETIDILDNKNKIKVIVHEVAIQEEDERLSQDSSFLLDNVPILESVKKEIHMDFPEEFDTLISADMMMYIESLFSLMSNDGTFANKLNFAEDYVFVLTSTLVAFFKNNLPEAFKGLSIGYSSVGFLKKLCESSETINVHKIDRYLCIQAENTEAFIKYSQVKIKYRQYVDILNKDNGIVLDRLYLKDVLRRMSGVSLDGRMCITNEGELEVTNEAFTQLIPINKSKGDVSELSFKISVPIIEKSIVGNDMAFPDELFIYFIKKGSGYTICVTDKTGAWFSQMQVRY